MTDGAHLVVVADGELQALSYLPGYERTRVGTLERRENGRRFILVSRSHAADLARRSERLQVEAETLLASHGRA